MSRRRVRCDVGTMGTLVLREVLVQEHPTTTSIARALGRSKSTVHSHLVRLRRMRLVTWDYDRHATLRPLVAVVPCGSSTSAGSSHPLEAQQSIARPAGPADVDTPQGRAR